MEVSDFHIEASQVLFKFQNLRDLKKTMSGLVGDKDGEYGDHPLNAYHLVQVGNKIGVWDNWLGVFHKGYGRLPQDEQEALCVDDNLPYDEVGIIQEKLGESKIAHYPKNQAGGSHGKRTHNAW